MTGRTRIRHLGTAFVAAVALVALAGCEFLVYERADADREQGGLPALSRSNLLRDAARAKSADMCAAGSITPSTDAKAAYDLETIAGASELVGSAPLDPGVTDPLARNSAATEVILDSWSAPPWSAPTWDDIGVGEVECPDGRLYLTAVTTDRPTMPATGRYSSLQYPLGQIQEHLGLQYATAVNYLGQSQALLLDLYLPPGHGADRPLIILVHGGGFANGDRSNLAAAARDYARRGYVAVSLGYRLNPTLQGQSDLEAYLAAARNAVDDGMESVRWLRSNAATYQIDINRIAMMGTSAGGGIALGTAVMEDPTPGGPLAGFSPRVNAAVATGATLILGLDEVAFDESDSPIMMIHFETDTATGATTADVLTTCEAVWTAGSTCDQVIRPGAGHGSPLSGSGPWWSPEIGPDLWEHLGLS
jgi:dienelactone hydrolase